MKKSTFVAPAAIVCALLCTPTYLAAQSVTLGGALAVASAEDFATRSFQDPWDMDQRTDFGWFLHGSDNPLPELSNFSFSQGQFHATTGTSPNLFLLETGNPFAARLGKTGTNYPINADLYKLVAIRMAINGNPQAVFSWNRDNLWDGTNTTSGIFTASPGWRTYLVDISLLGKNGPTAWGGLIRSLQFRPSYSTQFQLDIDWIRLVSINTALCRNVTWSGLGSSVNLYLDTDQTTNGNETLLFSPSNIRMPGESTTASHGCTDADTGSGYTFYAGGLAPGTYYLLARASTNPTGPFTRSASAYVVNAAPTITITNPSEEGSTDDFATAQLGNAWDMDAVSDVDWFNNVTNPTITNITTETPGGTTLGSTRVLHGTSTPAAVGDPIVQVFWPSGPPNIDAARYRILTAEFGMNAARNVNEGSIARIIWRVVGSTDSVSDDIILNSRLGVNVLDKITLDMADRTVLPIEEGSQAGWLAGTFIDRFRFDPHEFSNAANFYIHRIKLAALDRAPVGTAYTFRWTASEPNGTVTFYRDNDRNEFNGGHVLIGSTATSANSFTWTVPSLPAGEYYIYAQIHDNQGNSNSVYARWPLAISGTGGPPPPTAPPRVRIMQ